MFGDSIGAGLVHHMSKDDLDELGEVADRKANQSGLDASGTDISTLDNHEMDK